MTSPTNDSEKPAWTTRASWVLLWAILISSLYLPTLGTRFDFADDGNLVYPAPAMSPAERIELYWEKVIANYRDLGPFRPVLWLHWEIQAEMFGANELCLRLCRLVWTTLSAASLLWLMLELGIAKIPAIIATALAMWNPYRNEIWRSLTLAEGVAMPYALFALVSAVRAARSPRPRVWDLAGSVCILAAPGCKNTFAALVPAQMLLRISGSGGSLLEGWRRHGLRACLMALTLLLPIAHFVFFQIHWHPGQYPVDNPSWSRVSSMLRLLKGTINLDFVGPGLLLALLAISGIGPIRQLRTSWSPAKRYRLAFVSGLSLLIFGIAIYLPVSGSAGRYSMPAVWGLDLWVGVLVSMLAQARSSIWKRLAYFALRCGIVGVVIANLGKQDRFAAQNTILWQALEHVEREAPKGASLGFVIGANLGAPEAVHSYWHLRGRGRNDITVVILDSEGKPVERREFAKLEAGVVPVMLITEQPEVPFALKFQLIQKFFVSYRWGTEKLQLYLWGRTVAGPP